MSRDIEAGKAFIRLGLTGHAQVKQYLASIGTQMRSYGALASKLTAAIGAIGIGSALVKSIKDASDMQETMSKFNVVFGESAEAVKKWGDDLGAAIGRSKKEVAGFLASSQDLLVPLGFGADEAENLSKQIVQLAFDLGSFNNMADEDVFRDLMAAMTGSGEVMKKYGVVVSEARVKQELLNQSIDPAKATEAQKAFARLTIIMQGTTAAQGDALRTSDGFANSMKRFHAVVADVSVELGQKFLPEATKIIRVLTDAILVLAGFGKESVSGFDAATISAEKLTHALAGIVNALNKIQAALKPVIVGLGILDPKMRRAILSFDARGILDTAIQIDELLKKSAKDWNSDFGKDFEEQMKALDQARKAGSDPGFKPAFLGVPSQDVQKSIEETTKAVEELSPQQEAQMKALMEQEKAQAKEHTDKLDRQLKAQERANRSLADISRKLDDTTTVEVLDH